MKRIFTFLAFLAGAVLLSNCGGGGGGGGAAITSPPTKATVSLFTQGTLTNGTAIGGVDVTIHLPPGVTVKSTVTPPETDSGVAVASGLAVNDSWVMTTYDETAHTVRFQLANVYGFTIGKFATINCDISGTEPKPTDFSLSGILIKDLDSAATITSDVTVVYTAVIQ